MGIFAYFLILKKLKDALGCIIFCKEFTDKRVEEYLFLYKKHIL